MGSSDSDASRFLYDVTGSPSSWVAELDSTAESAWQRADKQVKITQSGYPRLLVNIWLANDKSEPHRTFLTDRISRHPPQLALDQATAPNGQLESVSQQRHLPILQHDWPSRATHRPRHDLLPDPDGLQYSELMDSRVAQLAHLSSVQKPGLIAALLDPKRPSNIIYRDGKPMLPPHAKSANGGINTLYKVGDTMHHRVYIVVCRHSWRSEQGCRVWKAGTLTIQAQQAHHACQHVYVFKSDQPRHRQAHSVNRLLLHARLQAGRHTAVHISALHCSVTHKPTSAMQCWCWRCQQNKLAVLSPHSLADAASGRLVHSSTLISCLRKAVLPMQTELCRSWEESGSCRYGNKCQFAHGRRELRMVQRHPKYKTEVSIRFCYIRIHVHAK